jgi:hypothetical protein
MAITASGLIKLGFKSEVDFVVQDNSDGNGAFIAEWLSDQPQPSVAEIEAADVEYQTAWDSQEYARNRKAEYPAIVDQLDDIYHNGIDAWKATIKVTKDKYPKE